MRWSKAEACLRCFPQVNPSETSSSSILHSALSQRPFGGGKDICGPAAGRPQQIDDTALIVVWSAEFCSAWTEWGLTQAALLWTLTNCMCGKKLAAKFSSHCLLARVCRTFTEFMSSCCQPLRAPFPFLCLNTAGEISSAAFPLELNKNVQMIRTAGNFEHRGRVTWCVTKENENNLSTC